MAALQQKRYKDPVLPKLGDYVHGEQVATRTHADCIAEFEIVTDINVVKHAYCKKKFFAGPVTGTNAKGFMVRNLSTRRVRTISKDTAVACMAPEAYYRNKSTGEWYFCKEITGTHARLVAVFDNDEEEQQEEEEENNEEEEEEEGSDYTPDDASQRQSTTTTRRSKRQRGIQPTNKPEAAAAAEEPTVEPKSNEVQTVEPAANEVQTVEPPQDEEQTVQPNEQTTVVQPPANEQASVVQPPTNDPEATAAAAATATAATAASITQPIASNGVIPPEHLQPKHVVAEPDKYVPTHCL